MRRLEKLPLTRAGQNRRPARPDSAVSFKFRLQVGEEELQEGEKKVSRAGGESVRLLVVVRYLDWGGWWF